MEFTDKEKELIKYMYENLHSMAELIGYKLNGSDLTSNDVYDLFEKLGLQDIVFD